MTREAGAPRARARQVGYPSPARIVSVRLSPSYPTYSAGVTRQFRIVDLFSGCGGMTTGFAETGLFTPVAAVELDQSAAATYALNHGEHVYVGDINAWVRGSTPRADVIVGGPPCQGFSALGKKDPKDPRNGLWDAYAEAVRKIRPAFFVLENVPQFVKSQQYAALQRETTSRGRLTGWELEAHVVNAANYGTAQNRRRAVVIGRRSGVRPIGLPPSTAAALTVQEVLTAVPASPLPTSLPASRVTVNGAVAAGPFRTTDLHFSRRPSTADMARYRAIPPGGDRRDLPPELMHRCWREHGSGRGDVMGRLHWGKPAVTIRTEFFRPEKGRFLHPVEHRPITHLEAALIQGFPRDFLWAGTPASIARQIGNAVPPPLARALAEHLAKRLV
ncbi:DNA (cytosine-5)-methyltransferase 1 [Ornithinimicrobium cerasi]|uniref:Cytosine-specific methyltransferase n=1 Tax=Ornithinimicrobium cerasi TaxID=2248773 RepID=A0A285VGP8_9MICO|nr:DNA (cytosine-5)-methyltransferase 1 [Ornithinimicrobium cerasi]